MSDFKQNMPPLPKTAYNEFKLRINGSAPLEGAQYPPSLGISMVANQPRFEIFTGIKQDGKNLILRAKMDTDNYFAVLAALRELIAGENDTMVRVANLQGPPHSLFKDSTLVFGKSPEGVIFVSVMKKNAPNIMIKLLPSKYHNWSERDGQAMSEDRVSRFYAMGWVRRNELLMANVLDTHFAERQMGGGRPNGGGGGGGYNNNRGGNGGGGGNYNGGNNQRNGNYSGSGGGGGGKDFGDEFPM